jgi:uncharacterized protein (TIGR02996 family)
VPFPKNPPLEAAVIADAENDLPRLVYADWLDEHGDPARAGFIRVLCALHDKNPADPDYPDLIEQRREAFDGLTGRLDLAPKLPRGVDFHDSRYDPDRDDTGSSYHRGFPYFAQQPYLGDGWTPAKEEEAADRFAAALPEVLARTTLRGLDVSEHFSRQLHRILPAQACGQLSAFADNGSPWGPSTGVVDAVVRSPLRASVRWLDLDVKDAAEATALAAAKLPRLHRWDAHHGFRCPPAAAKKLVSADWFAGLHRLLCPFTKGHSKTLWSALARAPHLHTVHVWGQGVLAPLGAKPFRSLGRLHLHAATPTKADLNGLIRAKLPNLAVLEVTNGGLRNDGLKALTAADWFAGLRVLELDCDDLGDQGIVALGKSAVAPHLRSLTVGTSKLRPKGFASLAVDYPSLTTLDLSASHTTKMTPEEMAAFTEALSLPCLRHLRLQGWSVGDAGAVALANNPAVANLTRLALEYAEVGAKGIRAIVESPHLQRLVYLNLSSSPGGAGMDALTDPGVLPRLAHCWLPDGVSKAVYKKLVSARGAIFVGGPN